MPQTNVAISLGAATDPVPYVRAVEAAGFAARVFTPGSRLPTLPMDIGAIVFGGGAAVMPSRFGQDHDPAIKRAVDEDRDAMEWHLADQALARGLPVMGICRGMQFLNVYFGGTLCQNLAAGSWQDDHRPDLPRDAETHAVIARGGRVRDCLGDRPFMVNSIHRQGIADLAATLTATATTGDGLIEACEDPSRNIVAVQWHPEELAPRNPAHLRLFAFLGGGE